MQEEQGLDNSILYCSCEKTIKTMGCWLPCLSVWYVPVLERRGWERGARSLDVLTAWVTVLARASWRQAGSLALVTLYWLEWVSLDQSRVCG